MTTFIQISQFLTSICLLVLLHELGHFMFARLFKTRVEKFYLFFNPWFSIFKIKKGDTEYGLGWLPLGGYVKISGMIDESMDREQMKQEPKPWEFRSKPAWQRLLIISGGVMVNFILAMIIFIMILFVWGKEYLPMRNSTYGIAIDSLAFQAGFRDGDKILTIDNKPVESYSHFIEELILGDNKQVTVLRNNIETKIEIQPWLISDLIKSENASFISPRFPFVINGFTEDSEGKKAGLQKDDKIIGLNSDTVLYFHEFRQAIQKLKNQQARVKVIRNNDTITVVAKVPESGLLGIAPYGWDKFFTFDKTEFTLLQAIPAGIKEGLSTLTNYVRQFKLIFKNDGHKSLGSFITFTKIFPGIWDWQAFWGLTAFISIILAFMNILPIPALDGGYIIFILYEMITRRKPSEKFMEYAQITGMILILTLMLYATNNDIQRYFFK